MFKFDLIGLLKNYKSRQSLLATIFADLSPEMSIVLDYLPISLIYIDSEGVIQYANLTAANLIGIDKSKLIGIDADKIYSKESEVLCESKLLMGSSSSKDKSLVRIRFITGSVIRGWRTVGTLHGRRKRIIGVYSILEPLPHEPVSQYQRDALESICRQREIDKTEWIDTLTKHHAEQMLECIGSGDHLNLTELCPFSDICACMRGTPAANAIGKNHEKLLENAAAKQSGPPMNRKHFRVQFSIPLSFRLLFPEQREAEDSFGSGILQNLSVGGISFCTTTPVPVNSLLEIWFNSGIICDMEGAKLKVTRAETTGHNLARISGRFEGLNYRQESIITRAIFEQEIRQRNR